MENQDPTS